MRRHTISLCMIAKNEAHNVPRLAKSIEGCFDQIILVDTGSTDNTVDVARSLGWQVEHFDWCDDFSMARNSALEYVTSDYWMWLDLDDELHDPKSFIKWRDTAMPLVDFWLAPYYYGFDKNGAPSCTFIRERVFRTALGLRFESFIHEGVRMPPKCPAQAIQSWRVNHRRTDEEQKQDHGRNLSILEKRKDSLDPRLQFYLGKEMFDNGKTLDAAVYLREVLKSPKLDQHDRVMGIQYMCHSLIKMNQFEEAIRYALIGVQADPTRAEFYCLIGDCYISQNQHRLAIPFYLAACGCGGPNTSGLTVSFSSPEAYSFYPKINLAKIYFMSGDFKKALEYASDLEGDEARKIVAEAERAIILTQLPTSAVKTEDIVISCPPQGAYLWDEKIYHEKGVGGSETAAVEMARWLRHETGRNVIVFNPRTEEMVSESGVEYRSATKTHEYFHQYEPKLHIAWRHPTRLTRAPSVVWCHDLVTPGAENINAYDHLLCLSEFHKNYVQSMQGIPDEKIIVTRNGLSPEKFMNLSFEKKHAKVIWPNSPDRGLDHAILIMDKVREMESEAELHIFYGMDNMFKYGMGDQANALKKMIAERPWVKYHGNVDQRTLVKEFASSQVWLYPATFIETYCISAQEALAAKAYPVCREIGALQDTMRAAAQKGWADLLDVEPVEVDIWAKHVVDAIREEKWKRIELQPETISWRALAKDWVKMFGL